MVRWSEGLHWQKVFASRVRGHDGGSVPQTSCGAGGQSGRIGPGGKMAVVDIVEYSVLRITLQVRDPTLAALSWRKV